VQRSRSIPLAIKNKYCVLRSRTSDKKFARGFRDSQRTALIDILEPTQQTGGRADEASTSPQASMSRLSV